MSSYNKHLPYIGQTPFFACQFDQRFSYCLYVPKDYYTQTQDNFNLLVIIHGSARTAERYRNLFADFAEENQCIVLAPLFPIGIEDPLEQ
ncbi:MAG: hypothetical protein JKY84_13915, partial [Emcibacteraceae bacterium]|nr:hypothetical protein [Emcibacteraceae bacterium]